MQRYSRTQSMDNKTVLDPYTLTGVTVTDRVLGQGSYATILELEYMGLKCAGKKIHEMLLRQGGESYSVRRFEEECRLISQVRHPNVVQFLGVHFQQGVPTPILVMEFLPTNLTSCIEQYSIIRKDISYSILYDVALGLHYLHSQTPPIIHRDLSANNVLLTPFMTAKISDLGVARILNLTPLQLSRLTQSRHLTGTPGTPSYMPPEVMVADPKYNESLDVFSYGILMIHMFSGRWPEPQVGPSQVEGDQLIPVTEGERRDVFLRGIGNDHPLKDLTLKCINNDARERPKSSEIVECLSNINIQFSAPFTDRIQMLTCMEENIDLIDKLEKTVSENTDLKEEIKGVKEELEQNKRDHEVDRTLHKKKKNLFEKELEQTREKVEANEIALKMKDEIISKLNVQLFTAREYLSSKRQAVKAYIKWTNLKEVSESVIGSQAVVISGKVYVAGQTSTYCYQPSDDNWTTLPPPPVKQFGLGQFNGKLVAIGGQIEKNGGMHITDEVYTYEEKSRKWKHTIPPMPTARFDPGVLSLQSALVVAGGEVADMECTNAVEILKGERKEDLLWCTTNPLRVPCSRISIVSTGDTLYVIGGYIRQQELMINQALYASISELLHCAAPLNETNHIGRHAETQSAWKTIHNTFAYNPAAAVLAGNLITLGGWVEAAGGEIKKEVYVYSSSTDSWVYIGDLPVPLARTIVAAVSCSQILLIGGFSVGESMKSVYSGMFIVDL